MLEVTENTDSYKSCFYRRTKQKIITDFGKYALLIPGKEFYSRADSAFRGLGFKSK